MNRIVLCLCVVSIHLTHAVYADSGLLAAELKIVPELVTGSNATPAGVVNVWNTTKEFHVQVIPDPAEWYVKTVDIYVGYPRLTVPGDLGGTNYPTRSVSYEVPATDHHLALQLVDDLGLAWGQPYEALRTQTVAVRVQLANVDGSPRYQTAWALNPELTSDEQLINVGASGYQFSYECMHPRSGHFIDSPVSGLGFSTSTHSGKTEDGGLFNYFPGETVELAIGNVSIGQTLAAQKVSPLDLFDGSDTESAQVINMARLLQSLDAEASPENGILLTEAVEESLDAAMTGMGIETINFYDDMEIDELIARTVSQAAGRGVSLTSVSAEDAQGNLEKSLDSVMFRKNVSKTPEMESAKSKMNVMGVWFPAKKANGDPAVYEDGNGVEQEGVAYCDEDGDLIRVEQEAKPLIVVYCDAIEETGSHDVFAAVSRDDGNTWKRKNVSRMADRASFTLATGEEYYGHCKKPVFQVKGNKICIAWTSKFARGGRPAYAIKVDDPATTDTNETDYAYDDDYYNEDIWGVSGPQRSVTYDDYPEVGEVPYSAIWTVRGLILTEEELSKAPFNTVDTNGAPAYVVGDIVWFKPERLTSARRDANQVFMGGADSAGFAIAWQEDPEGLQPGEAKGPGPGWGGATTSHKTDIWYSYITWSDFTKVDTNFVAGGDPEHDHEDFAGRPKARVPMSLPVRISDNDTVNVDNMMIATNAVTGLPLVDTNGNFIAIYNEESVSEEGEGAHRYGYLLEGLWDWNPGNVYTEGESIDWEPGDGGALYAFTNQQEALKRVVITADGRALDGNTGASRPNLFLQTYTKPDGTKSAWAIMAYEETKGVGSGPDEETGTGEGLEDGSGYDPYDESPDEGKNAIYHSFDFQAPDLVSAGTILNLPETDTNGVPLYVAETDYLGSTSSTDADGNTVYTPIPNPDAGTLLTDWKGDPIYAYENARRPRFILQSKTSAFGGVKTNGDYKEPNNSGTVLMVLYKEGEDGAGRQSDIMARRCVVKDPDGNLLSGNPWAPKNFIPHSTNDARTVVQNLSTMNPLETWVNPDRDENAKGDGVKICQWDQPDACRGWKSGENPYEDARAHRGAIRGDFLVMGYSYTPNWAAARNAHDKYNFYLRRSFDGGQTWTTDPAADGTNAVAHFEYFINPDGISGAELDGDGNDASESTKHYLTTNWYAGGGVYEPARNLSLLKNNKSSVIEPRIVAVPGTIKVDGSWTGIDEDKQDVNVFYVAYGTAVNLTDEEKDPEDLYFSYSDDKGTTLWEDSWEVNPDSSGNHAGETVTGWFRLAKGDPEQGEVQIRMTPDGSRFYACWLEEGDDGSDIMFRRVMPSSFPVNVSTNKDDAGDSGDAEDPEAAFAELYDGWADICFGTNTADCGQLDDADGDGMCNVAEFIACTDAANGQSKFRVKKHGTASNGFVLSWDAVDGRRYGVYWAEDLTSGFIPLATNLCFPQNSFTDTVHSDDQNGFYYIDVQLMQ